MRIFLLTNSEAFLSQKEGDIKNEGCRLSKTSLVKVNNQISPGSSLSDKPFLFRHRPFLVVLGYLLLDKPLAVLKQGSGSLRSELL